MRALTLTLLLGAVLWAGVHWGTFVAGGSDSYCYVAQAERWAAADLTPADPLALAAPWPDAAPAFVPAGHMASPVVRGAVVPICPAGLSIAMAGLRLVGGRDAVFLAVPLFGVLLVAATSALGARYGARVGVTAAVLAAASPIVLFQLVQPMSDVPAAALWTAALAVATSTSSRGPLRAGLLTAAAILVRPNLVPLGCVIGLFLLLRPERTWRERGLAAAWFAAGAAVGCVAVALIQLRFYGSPFSSGYGSLSVLFSVDHVRPNASRYAAWMTTGHGPWWLLALAAPLLLPGALTWLLVAVVGVTVASYLPYVVFDDWSYLRFLLPALPALFVLWAATLDAVCRRIRPRVAGGVLALAAVVLALWFVRAAVEQQAFRLQALEARYARAGLYVGERLPASALVVTRWQSGSVRYYSGRPTLAWDALDPARLDEALRFAADRGLEPYFLFERGEEPLFREHFAGHALGALDWPPMAEVAAQVRVYRPGDQARYRRGEPVPTEYAR